MRQTINLLLAAVGLAACSQNNGSAQPVAMATSQSVTPASTAAKPTITLDAIEPCIFTSAEIAAAIGGNYAAGKAVAPIAGAPRRDCTYDEQGGADGQLRVNITWLEPASAATSRGMLMNMIAGATTSIPGDPDGAIFQDQTELGTYALHYSRGNLLYEVRLMTFRGGAAIARERLLRLKRP